MNTKNLILKPSLAILMVAAQPAYAALIAYDGFSNGPRSDLAGSTGGFGWTSPWTDASGGLLSEVVTAGLTFTGLPSQPGACLTQPFDGYSTTEYQRSFSAVTGDRIFVSFLYRAEATTYGTYGGLTFGAYPLFVQVGSPPGYYQYGLRYGHYGFALSNADELPGVTTFLVVEIQSVPASGRTYYSLYVEPYPGMPKPSFADADASIAGSVLPTTVRLTNDGGVTTDEIRIGTTWADVVPGLTQPGTGDLNCDSVVNGEDVQHFVEAMVDPTGYIQTHPGCNRMNADLNGDGFVNQIDVDVFTSRLVQP